MCTYLQQTTDMTMTTMTEALQQKQNNIQLYTKTIGRSRGGHSIIEIIPIWWQNSFILPCIFVPGPDVPPLPPHATEKITGQHDMRIYNH